MVELTRGVCEGRSHVVWRDLRECLKYVGFGHPCAEHLKDFRNGDARASDGWPAGSDALNCDDAFHGR